MPSNRRVKYRKNDQQLWVERCLYAQDLFTFKMNIAAHIPQNEFESFQQCCRLTATELHHVLQIKTGDREMCQFICNDATQKTAIKSASSLRSGTGKRIIYYICFYRREKI